MKTVERAALCIMGSFIGVFIGSGIWKYWNYKKHPEFYIQNSAPWYTGLILNGIVTLVVVLICMVIIAVIKRKSAQLTG